MNIPSQIGPYKVVCEVGKGPYFRLFRCMDNNGQRLFIKLINLAKLEELQVNPGSSLPSEAEIGATLNHPNILRQIGSDEVIVDGHRFHYVASEFVSGENLTSKLSRDGHLTVYEVKLILTGILNALKYLHSQKEPIIVNGISPESIYLDLSHTNLISKFSDFGHARKLNRENRKCYMGGLSPFYLAPEFFKGLYSTRTDLYAVGALMYHLIYGIEPWKVDLSTIDWNQRITAIIEARKAPLPIPDIKIFELDDQMLNIMSKALTQDVDERFQTADEFLQALNGTIRIDSGNFTRINTKNNVEVKEEPSTKSKGNGFADVAGLDSLKRQLTEEVIDLLRNPEKYRRLRVKIPNGILLYGPPCCGKTFIAEKFAEEIGCNFIKAYCSDIASPYIHGGQGKISELFKEAEENAPTVLFLDEIDAMITNRLRHTNVSEQGEVNVFLTNLNNCSDRGIFVVAATNNPDMIDPAALRAGRLDLKMFVPLPDKEERKKILRLVLSDRCEADIDYDLISEKTEGYVSNDICQMVNKAALVTARNNGESISQKVLIETIENGKSQWPSVSMQEIERQLQIKSIFESKKTPKRPSVGFITKTEI